MGLTGHKKRNGFLVGLTLAQISEFSFIVIALGVRSEHIQNDIVSLITLTGLITIAGSSYLIIYSEKLYPYFSNMLSIFERKQPKKIKESSKKYSIILFGYNRVGYDFVKTFQRLKKKFLVVDYNPDIISRLTDRKVECIYGDVDDPEFLDELNLDKIKMAVSTIPYYETNSLLIEKIRKVNRKAIIIVVSHHIDEAYGLYNKRVTYVLMPHFLGGKYMSNIIDRYGFNLDKFLKERNKQIKHLKERKEVGHEHPKTESVKY
jgi:Trk K+ transport system NAD-binding subunit